MDQESPKEPGGPPPGGLANTTKHKQRYFQTVSAPQLTALGQEKVHKSLKERDMCESLSYRSLSFRNLRSFSGLRLVAEEEAMTPISLVSSVDPDVLHALVVFNTTRECSTSGSKKQ